MEVKAVLRYLRISPRKVRLVANLIKGKTVKEAENSLRVLKKRAREPLLKLLKSAVSNAKHNFNLSPENLFISELRVDEGPALKRWMPRARGSASLIKKRSSHVYLVLKEISEENKVNNKKRKKNK
ncbi:MAG: 50S ribosomal protein L22 [Candidatus Paceibacterota bacterium]